MNEIILSEEVKAADGYLAAYRKGVIDMYASLGMLKEETEWLWLDVAAQS